MRGRTCRYNLLAAAVLPLIPALPPFIRLSGHGGALRPGKALGFYILAESKQNFWQSRTSCARRGAAVGRASQGTPFARLPPAIFRGVLIGGATRAHSPSGPGVIGGAAAVVHAEPAVLQVCAAPAVDPDGTQSAYFCAIAP